MTNLQLVEDANLQVVHEVYDLLSDPDREPFQLVKHNGSDEWLLNKPSLTTPLRAIRFTKFQPIYKHGLIGLTYTASVNIRPIIVKAANSSFTFEHLDATHTLTTNSQNDGNGLAIPVPNNWEHSFTYDGTFEDLSHNINDTFDIYFKDLYSDGYLIYDANGTKYVSASVMKAVTFASYAAGLKSNSANDDNLITPISFNCTNLSIDDVTAQGANIQTTFVWFKLTQSSNSVYVIFVFDVDCNSHSFSVGNGELMRQLFIDVDSPPQIGESAYYGSDEYRVTFYDDNLTTRTRALLDSNLLISLCSSFAGNLTGKIFTGENIYQTVTIETFPSSMYFPITIRSKNNENLDIETLKQVYDQITLAVDYVYLTY